MVNFDSNSDSNTIIISSGFIEFVLSWLECFFRNVVKSRPIVVLVLVICELDVLVFFIAGNITMRNKKLEEHYRTSKDAEKSFYSKEKRLQIPNMEKYDYNDLTKKKRRIA